MKGIRCLEYLVPEVKDKTSLHPMNLSYGHTHNTRGTENRPREAVWTHSWENFLRLGLCFQVPGS